MRKRSWRKYYLLKGVVCADCGFSDWRVMHYHHRDPTVKRFTIKQALTSPASYTALDILAELAKCDVLCPTCHALRHTSLPKDPE